MIERAALADLLLAANVDKSLVERLAFFGAMLLKANERVNLTGARDAESVIPHIVDSLSIESDVSESLVDVGSGGGLPAIPLAIACGIPVTMIEATSKKAAFLRAALSDLGLDGEVVTGRAEVLAHAPHLREGFATGTARAVSSAPAVAELLLPFIRTGGRAVLQRGHLDDRERDALSDAALILGGRIQAERLLDGERRIVIVEKTGPTPSRFPRRVGIPEKRPLCM